MKFMFVLIALIGFALPGQAMAYSGKDYLDYCSLDKLQSLDKGAVQTRSVFCTTLIRGIIEGHYATIGYYEKKPLFCIPAESTITEITGKIIGQLGIEEKYLDKEFSGLVVIYLGRAFPCDKKQK